MFWFRQGLCFLPAFLVSWSSATFIISFVFAVYQQDIDVIFPYISDTGATPPESCLFGLMTVISAFAGTATVYIRYKLVEKQIEENNLVKPGLNEASLWLGIISCFGMCVVATFQETAVRWAHDLGALLFFSTGIIYITLQSVMSFKVYPYNTSKCVLLVRTGLTLLAVIAFFPTVICAFYPNSTSKMHWHRDDKTNRDGGDATNIGDALEKATDVAKTCQQEVHYMVFSYAAICYGSYETLQSYSSHLASSISEWIVAFSFVFYFYTYIDDFKLFTLRVRTECER